MGVFDKAKSASDSLLSQEWCEELDEMVYFKKLTAYEWQRLQAVRTQAMGAMVAAFTGTETASVERDNVSLIEAPFRLLETTWVDEKGELVITTDEQKKELRDGTIDAILVNALAKLAMEAAGFVKKKMTASTSDKKPS